MASTTTKSRFVRCPKCLQILTELKGVPVYKCGGCGAILRAKAHACSDQKSSTANSGSQELPGAAPLNDNPADPGHQTAASAVPSAIEQAESKNLCHEGDGIMNASISGSKNEILKGMVKPFVHEMDEVQQVEESQFEDGNEVVKASPDIRPDANVNLKSSDQEEDSVTMEHGTTSGEDMINMEFQNGACLINTIRSSRAVDESISSTDGDWNGDIRRNLLRHSRRTFRKKKTLNPFDVEKDGFMRRFSNERLPSCNGKASPRNVFQAEERDSSFVSVDFHSVGSWMHSESEGSCSSSPRTSPRTDLKFSEEGGDGGGGGGGEDDKLNILRKVDELRNDISELFIKTSKNTQFKVKTNHFQGGKCCQQGSYNACRCIICCHISQAARLNPHVGACTSLHQVTQNLQSKDSKPPVTLRHCRPVSGGAPFAICNNCFKFLLLPADFLALTRRVHRIRPIFRHPTQNLK